jgi:hypothetical protein
MHIAATTVNIPEPQIPDSFADTPCDKPNRPCAIHTTASWVNHGAQCGNSNLKTAAATATPPH